MNSPLFGRCFAALLLMLSAACGALLPSPAPPTSFYSLDSPPRAPPIAAAGAAPTLIVNPPHAVSGFASQHIVYVREAHRLDYFAHSEWVDTPARMLAPLIVAAIQNSGVFRAALPTPSAAVGDLRLDTEIVRLQHDFGVKPSQVQFTLRAWLVDNTTRRVVAWRRFDVAIPAASEDPYGGVVAANQAVQTVLQQLAAFCAETAGNAVKD